MSSLISDTQRKLPKNWRWVKLGSVCESTQSGFASGERDPEGVVQLRMNNLDTRGNFIWSNFIRVPASAEIVNQFRLLQNDVLFNNTNSKELVGKSGLFTGFQEDVVFSNHFTRIRTNPEMLSPSFLAAWLNNQWLLGVFSTICNSWIGQSAVKPGRLLALDFPLPPLPEQKRISNMLNDQMTVIDRARKAAEERMAAVNALSSAYLRSVFPALGHSLPKNWKWVKLRNHASKIGSGLTPLGGHSTYVDKGIPFIRSQNVHLNRFSREGLAFITDNQDGAMAQSRVCAGDILLNITGASIGRVCQVPEEICPANVNQHVSIIRCSESMDASFVSFYISSPAFQDYIMDMQAGATRQALTKSMIEDFNIVRPPISEQKRIVIVLKEKLAIVARAKQSVAEEVRLINSFPVTLLRQAFNGEF